MFQLFYRRRINVHGAKCMQFCAHLHQIYSSSFVFLFVSNSQFISHLPLLCFVLLWCDVWCCCFCCDGGSGCVIFFCLLEFISCCFLFDFFFFKFQSVLTLQIAICFITFVPLKFFNLNTYYSNSIRHHCACTTFEIYSFNTNLFPFFIFYFYFGNLL